MSKGMYHYIAKAWKVPDSNYLGPQKQRIILWRREPAIQRAERPTRLDAARNKGYKAKTGIVIVRARVPRAAGSGRPRPIKGRKPSNLGAQRYKGHKSLQWIAEERAARFYPNMEVLNSYWVGSDGKYKWYEIIFVDPNSPSIKSDKDLNWICTNKQNNRVYKGLTCAGKKARGLVR